MTDWDEIVEDIRKAVEALDSAESASQTMRRYTNHSTFEAFRQRMKELEERLTKLKVVLDHEEAFSLDELMDALSRVYSSHGADHRPTPRMDG